ncbi:MAG: peptidase S10 [Chloroflexota bacterium]|nr:MAG: peptidase S10 [Chloroflexota bacterium]
MKDDVKTTKPAEPSGDAANAEKPKIELKDELVETEHVAHIAGSDVAYKATAGRIVLKDEEEKAKAAIFFIAYTRNGVDDLSQRPVIFSFNGGPGSSSVWMHLGLLGPRRVLAGDAGQPVAPPYRLTDNEYSLLDRADIVFIDPVSTGYSRPAPGEDAKQFHGLEQDIESVGEFIRLYVTRYKRWSSPKFLIGESYGTTRAAGLAGYLQTKHGMYLNGLLLISSVLNFQTLEFESGNDLPYILFLPTYTATAWCHGRLAADLQVDLQKAIQEAAKFASSDYARALFLGSALPPDEHAAIVRQVARYTGLSESYVESSNLRIEIFRFCKQLLRDQRRTVGRLDSRFLGIDRDAAGERSETDPSYTAIQGAYSSAMNAYVREELGFEKDLPYAVLTGLYETWDYSKHQNKYVDVGETLRAAMTQNPFLHVFIANGYYDLATPFFATEYTVNHLHLEPELRDHVRMAYYAAGHMMYVHIESLAKLRSDMVSFLDSVTGHNREENHE